MGPAHMGSDRPCGPKVPVARELNTAPFYAGVVWNRGDIS
jgi:hypothetical protein